LEKVTPESLYNELKSNGALKEEVLATLKRVWAEQVLYECTHYFARRENEV
jgi:hypothetical protein